MNGLAALRTEIDRLDDEIAERLAARFALTDRVAAAKAATGKTVDDPAREQAILERLTLHAADGLKSDIAKIYVQIFACSKSRQDEIMSRSLKK